MKPTRRRPTRGDRAVAWIESYCVYPSGPAEGKPVRLSPAQRLDVLEIYDAPGGPHGTPTTREVAAYVALLHVCGPEALQRDFRPAVLVDTWTVWRATSAALRAVLRREGERIICPELAISASGISDDGR